MPKVTNLTDRGIPLFRHRLLPKSHKAVTPTGKIVEELPAEVAYSKRAKELHAKGDLEIAGLPKPKVALKAASKAATVVEPVKTEKPKKLDEKKSGK